MAGRSRRTRRSSPRSPRRCRGTGCRSSPTRDARSQPETYPRGPTARDFAACGEQTPGRRSADQVRDLLRRVPEQFVVLGAVHGELGVVVARVGRAHRGGRGRARPPRRRRRPRARPPPRPAAPRGPAAPRRARRGPGRGPGRGAPRRRPRPPRRPPAGAARPAARPAAAATPGRPGSAPRTPAPRCRRRRTTRAGRRHRVGVQRRRAQLARLVRLGQTGEGRGNVDAHGVKHTCAATLPGESREASGQRPDGPRRLARDRPVPLQPAYQPVAILGGTTYAHDSGHPADRDRPPGHPSPAPPGGAPGAQHRGTPAARRTRRLIPPAHSARTPGGRYRAAGSPGTPRRPPAPAVRPPGHARPARRCRRTCGSPSGCWTSSPAARPLTALAGHASGEAYDRLWELHAERAAAAAARGVRPYVCRCRSSRRRRRARGLRRGRAGRRRVRAMAFRLEQGDRPPLALRRDGLAAPAAPAAPTGSAGDTGACPA